jgi:hypothetical protein
LPGQAKANGWEKPILLLDNKKNWF